MKIQTYGDIAYVCGDRPHMSEEPSLILIHGAGQNHELWINQVQGIGKRFHTLALNLPGHEPSSGNGRDNIAAYADDVFGFITGLGIDYPVPCGMSMGGAIVQELLIHRRDDIPAGILVNTGARLRVLPTIFETIADNFEQFIEIVFSQGLAHHNQNEDMKRMIRSVTVCSPQVTADDLKACHKFDDMAEISSISGPVKILGAEYDKLTPVKYAEYLAEFIPEAYLSIIQNSGHYSMLEEPEAVNEHILAFLDELRSRP